MRDKRLIPAIENNEITNAELIVLLSSAEESGRQHIFLYSCDAAKAAELIDRARIKPILRSKGLERLLATADILEKPEHPQIVDVRWETASVDLNFVVKEVETRTRRKFLRNETEGNFFRKIYTNEQSRVVNLAKLHRDGLLELRIASHTNSSKYDGDVFRFSRQISAFIPMSEFTPISLTPAKDRL